MAQRSGNDWYCLSCSRSNPAWDHPVRCLALNRCDRQPFHINIATHLPRLISFFLATLDAFLPLSSIVIIIFSGRRDHYCLHLEGVGNEAERLGWVRRETRWWVHVIWFYWCGEWMASTRSRVLTLWWLWIWMVGWGDIEVLEARYRTSIGSNMLDSPKNVVGRGIFFFSRLARLTLDVWRWEWTKLMLKL